MMRISSMMVIAVASALAAPCDARHIKLEGEAIPGTMRFVSGLHVSLEEGKKTSWVTVTRTGTFNDPRYGQFEITKEMLLSMVRNFEGKVLGQEVFFDVAHQPSNGAAAKLLKLTVEGDRLRAQVEWTPYGIDAVKNKGYAYLSAEYHENWQDNEQGARHGPVLLGAALTVRPVIKRLDPVQLSEPDGTPPTLLHPELQTKLLSEIHIMWKALLKSLSEKFAAQKLSDAAAAQLIKLAELAVGNTTDETVAKAMIAAYEDAGKQLAESIAAGAKGDISIKLAVPDNFKTGMTEDDVKKLMKQMSEDSAAAAKKLQETTAAKVKLLTETIGAATGLDDAMKKELTEAVADLVTDGMTDEQVKKLAATQIASGNRLVAATKLAGMGYQVAGSVILSVDESNNINNLQDKIDERLGFKKLSEDRRFAKTGGKLQAANKEFAEMVLAEFDRDPSRAHRLQMEHKALAAGDSLVSDVSVPAIFERTVIREALYNLIGLQFCDVGTYPFSASALIPYSYRDTAAAGISQARSYEGQAIRRAAVKQTTETAYPIPQKLAFEVSDELRYLTGNGQLNWDVVVENTRNASRIIGEDLEKIIFDEVLNSNDQFLTTAVVSEATATANGTNKIFCLGNFPVVKPKKIFDLQGTQVGSTLYPITVLVNAVARTEYDGTNLQSPGIYWTMNYNLGEITFVTELGVPTAPTNTWAIVISYTYTTNVYKFDTDLGTDKDDEHWDRFLYRFGLRKAVVENDRYYSANFGLMSGNVRTMVEQARQFSANYQRLGTSLAEDGNLGRIKDVPQFRSTAPGLQMADARVIVGERANTRLRMMKPWSMGMLQDQKDSNGRFTGKKEAYGDQFVVCMTPTLLKGCTSSVALFSTAARINRVS